MARQYRKRHRGDRIGTWTLLGWVKEKRAWLARCDCGTYSLQNASRLSKRAETREVTCRRCHEESIRSTERKECRHPDCLCAEYRFNVSTECGACERTAIRNGRHGCCGAPIRKVARGKPGSGHFEPLPHRCGEPPGCVREECRRPVYHMLRGPSPYCSDQCSTEAARERRRGRLSG